MTHPEPILEPTEPDEPTVELRDIHLSAARIVGAVPVPDADPTTYLSLLRSAPTTHRCPVWVGPAARDYTDPTWAPSDPVAAIATVDVGATLADWWPGPCPSGCRCLEPFTGEFPGLVRTTRHDNTRQRTTLAGVRSFADVATDVASLITVEATRPADIPAVLGWTGAINYPHQSLAALCAVLRSWEDRFGAVLTWFSGSTLIVSVADPPRLAKESERVAAEHFAFCPDQVDPQNGREPYTPRTYGREIRGADLWRFWWD